jgi:hypothetical protein
VFPPACNGGSKLAALKTNSKAREIPAPFCYLTRSNSIACLLAMSHPEADCTRYASSGGEMIDRHSDRLVKKVPVLMLAALAFALSACSTATNCALFGLQCNAAPVDESKAAAAEALAKQEDATLGPKGHYGTPYGPGPQYGEGGGDQYGYGPAYSYARQVPSSPDETDEKH